MSPAGSTPAAPVPPAKPALGTPRGSSVCTGEPGEQPWHYSADKRQFVAQRAESGNRHDILTESRTDQRDLKADLKNSVIAAVSRLLC